MTTRARAGDTVLVDAAPCSALLLRAMGLPVCEPADYETPEACRDRILLSDPRPSRIAVNAHHCFGSSQSLSACGGLRLAELLRLERDFDVPILVYGWLPRSGDYGSARTRSCSGFVARYSTILSQPDDARHTVCLRLPASSAGLITAIDALPNAESPADRASRLRLRHALLEEELERECHSIRHQSQNVLAAMRLLLGAFAAGDIGRPALEQAMGGLGDQRSSLDRLVGLQESRAEAQAALGHAAETHLPPRPEKPRSARVLIVDDHLEPTPPTPAETPSAPVARGDLGWRVVYEALFTRSQRFAFSLVTAGSYDEALYLLDEGALSETDIVLLDVDLGDPEKSGLHLLREIRGRDPFVPVLQMTAFDDAEVCQTSLELQADAFLVKQLQDSTDRSSLAYYAKLVEVVGALLGVRCEDRELYRRFTDLLPLIRAGDKARHIARLEDGVCGELAKLFMLMRMQGTHHLFNSLVTGGPCKRPEASCDELMLVLMDAVLAWLNWDCNHLRDELGQDRRIDGIGKWLWLADRPGTSADSDVMDVASLANQWAWVRHGQIAPVGLRQVRDVLGALLSALGQTKTDSSGRKPPRGGAAAEVHACEGLAEVVLRARDRQVAELREHAQKSHMGAEGVLLGRYACSADDGAVLSGVIGEYRGFGKDQPVGDVIDYLENECEGRSLQIPLVDCSPEMSLLLVDDRVVSSGWAYVSQLVHNNASVACAEFPGPPHATSLRHYVDELVGSVLSEVDLVLLDLEMPATAGDKPSAATGLGVGAILRELDPIVPVAVLSAHLEARAMRTAIAAGATEFFPKEVPGTARACDLRDYGARFTELPLEFGLGDPQWLSFLRECRVALRELATATADPSSVHSPLLGAIERSGLPSPLLGHLGLAGTATVADAQQRVLGQVQWLVRRALFYAYTEREPYLRHWLPYFTSAISDLRPHLLGYDQTWLDCGMVVDFLYSILAFSCGGALKAWAPEQREREATDEAATVERCIGKEAYRAGMRIWKARNERRTRDASHLPGGEQSDPVRAIRECLTFLRGIGLLQPTPSRASAGPALTELRAHLRLSYLRARLLQLETRLGCDLEEQQSLLRRPGREAQKVARCIARVEARLQRVRPCLSGLEVESYLKDRRALLGHLWPGG